MYVTVTHCSFVPGRIEQAGESYRTMLVPLISVQPGFISLISAQTGDESATSIVAWESEQAAKAAEQVVLPRARELHGPIMTEMQRYSGAVDIHQTAAATAAR
jgi:heme-degrading monooxygenase HmoA